MTQINFRASDKLLSAAFACAILFSATPAGAEAVNRCARYGADYVAVSGSTGCVRLGGHVRVELRRNQLAPTVATGLTPTLAPMGYAAQDGVQPAAERVAQQPISPFDMLPR